MTTMEQGEDARPDAVAGEPASGPAAAAVLAAGIGSLVLGMLTTWAEASEADNVDLPVPGSPPTRATTTRAAARWRPAISRRRCASSRAA